MVKKQSNSLSRSRSNGNSNFNSYFNMGFGLGLGFGVAEILLTFVAFLFFIPGFILLKREQAKEKKGEKANTGLKTLAYVLMIIGALFAVVLIIPILSNLGGEFDM
jgi:hypothetical protein